MLGLSLAVTAAAALPPTFEEAGFLPGDLGSGASTGDQRKVAIAAAGPGFLVTWTDTRTSNLLYDGFGDDQSGDDVYAARLDGDGNLLDSAPIIVSQAEGTQEIPRSAGTARTGWSCGATRPWSRPTTSTTPGMALPDERRDQEVGTAGGTTCGGMP